MTSRILACILLSLLASASAAQEMQASADADEGPLVRELLVPFEHLDVVLKDAGRRVFLTREEYEQLVQRASVSGERPAPIPASLLSASYSAKLLEERVHVQGTLLIDVTAQGIQSIPLPLVGAGLLRAELDGQPAALGIPRKGQSRLFVEGKGRHTLTLELFIPVKVAAAQQTLAFQLPTAAAGRFELTVPGSADIKSGVSVLERRVDQGQTTFAFLPQPELTTLVLSLSSDQSGDDQIVVARTVLVDELTETY